jgi:hypothetical protein
MARARTGELPMEGAAPRRIPEVEKLADDYVDARDRRMELSAEEHEAKEALAGALHKAAESGQIRRAEDGEIRYVFKGGDKDRRVITLRPSDEKLSVKDVEAFEE